MNLSGHYMIITIDGPTASGKTTVARLLAEKLGYYYLSSGLLFRGVAYVLVHDLSYTPNQLHHICETDIKKAIDSLAYSYNARDKEQLCINKKNVTQKLHTEAISQFASIIATNANVRAALTQLQYRIADNHNLIAEGRDMGTTIFPQAQIKFFLTASLDIRALRWKKEQQLKGTFITLEHALNEVKERDERDAHRALAPLCIPEGAHIIDDSNIDQQQVLDKITAMIANYQNLKNH